MEEKNKPIPFETALTRAQALCAKQERCSYDIKAKLKGWGLPPDKIEKVMETLINDKFINDERYANMFVRDKSRFNKWGPIKIAQALRAKRISDNIVKESIKTFGSNDNEMTLIELLKKKSRSIKAKSPADLKSKLLRFGVSRGFSYEMVIGIIDKYY